MLRTRRQARTKTAAVIPVCAASLTAGYVVAGRSGLGALLTGLFVLQVTPSICTAYRTDAPTGVSPGTWGMIFGELSCWTIFGIHKSDPRLIALGITGVTASTLMLARVRHYPTNCPVRRPQ